MSEFREVADRVWVARYEWYDVNVSVVEGDEGLLVVDTNASAAAAHEVVVDLRRLSSRPLLGLVNTHAHFDHTFGNATFLEEYGAVPVTAHEEAAATLPAHAAQVQESAATDPAERAGELAATTVAVPDRTFSSVLALDLGDRAVELVHPGRGHTSGDLVVRVGDADVVLAGDLVEESGSPAWGEDSWPLEWPWTLDVVLSLLGPDTVVVPGHGSPVGLDFVQEQRSAIGVVVLDDPRPGRARRTPRGRAGGDAVALPRRGARARRTPWLRAAAPRRPPAPARLMELRTERLLLRGWTDADRPVFAALNADPEVMVSLGPPLTREASDAFVDRIAANLERDGYGLWAVEVRGSGELVGFTGLARQTFEAPFNPSTEVGWRLVRSAWGHGYATEAARAALVVAFEQLGLDEVVSMTTRVNERSQRVMRRLGMTRSESDDYEQERFPVGHPLRPAVLHRLTRARWESLRADG